MHRKSDYDNLPEDYTTLTGNNSYGSLGGDGRFPIMYNYYLIGKRTFFLFEIFISRISWIGPGKRGYQESILSKDFNSLNAVEKGEYIVAHSWT